MNQKLIKISRSGIIHVLRLTRITTRLELFSCLSHLCIHAVLILQGPVLIESLAGKCEIIKIATNPECKHYMALSREGEVYSWGSGDGGKLGHGDNK